MLARSARRLVVIAASVAALTAGGLGVASPAASAESTPWAPAATATVHPGVQVFTAIGQCTANFVFFQGDERYLGMAAHCAGQGAATDLDGCSVGNLPVGTPVEIDGASRPGALAYSSWSAMQAAGEEDPFTCRFNDFALVRIDPADHGRINPSIPHWGGPTAVRHEPHGALEPVYSLGNSGLRQGIELLQPKVGFSLGSAGGGWTRIVYNVLPGIPGDSGGPALDAEGRATGVLSTLGVAPLAGSNNLTDVLKALRYARAHGMPNLLMAVGTVPFNPNQLPLG